MENKAKRQPVTLQSDKNAIWNTDKPKISNLVNVIAPPKNHNGYVVIQDDKIVGPRYMYYETAWENVGCGIVTTFDLAVKDKHL